MNEGVYLKCDPYTGWSVVIRDEWGVERTVVNSVPTMEEAMRQAAMASGQAHYLKLMPTG